MPVVDTLCMDYPSGNLRELQDPHHGAVLESTMDASVNMETEDMLNQRDCPIPGPPMTTVRSFLMRHCRLLDAGEEPDREAAWRAAARMLYATLSATTQLQNVIGEDRERGFRTVFGDVRSAMRACSRPDGAWPSTDIGYRTGDALLRPQDYGADHLRLDLAAALRLDDTAQLAAALDEEFEHD